MEVGLRTPLYDWHVAHGAKMMPFAGYEMPIEYSGVLSEHEAVRQNVGIFDVSHMGKIRVTGNALEWLNSLLTNDLSVIENNRAQYSMLLNHSGGVVDDLIVYRISETEIWLVPNASNAAKVFSILQDHLVQGVSVKNFHDDYCIFALQGPRALSVMNELGVDGSLEYMSAGWQQFENDKILICRTGYTGELGFELIVPNSVAHQIWMKVIEAGVTPIGLGARDTLRLEMGYPLHGNDISEEINPFEAGLKWAVAMSKPTFLGKEALESLNLQRKRIALQMIDRGIPRGHMKVYHDGNLIGEITSGGFSPTLKVGIALALVDISFTGTELDVDIRSKLTRAQVVKLPLVKGSAR